MTRRAPQEPTRDFKPSHRLRDDAALYAPSLGCGGCPDFATCGGLHTDAGVFDCNDFCSCQDRATCNSVCRNKPEQFFERYVEIGGFELESTPRVDTVAIPELPSVIPLIGHKYSRKTVLNESVVAVPLYDLFHMRSGQPHVRTRAELAARFRILETATVVASGVDRDAKLEAWWAFADRALIMSTLRDLGIALVSVPNFSLILNVPRPDNLHSMKRIALGWVELMAAGLPAALHLNARTDQDYARWMRFVRERPEVEIVAFEFRTGAGVPSRIDWHVDRLCRIADAAGRPLTLVVRGGAQVLHRSSATSARLSLSRRMPSPAPSSAAGRNSRRPAACVGRGYLLPRARRSTICSPTTSSPSVRRCCFPTSRRWRGQSVRPGTLAGRHSTLTVKPGRGAFWRSWTRPWRLGLWPQISSA